jgi:hypothetical protein
VRGGWGRRASWLRPRRLCWLGLVAGIAVTTVTVPVLIFPRPQRTPPHRAAPSTTAAPSPRPTGSAPPPASPASPASPVAPVECAGRPTAAGPADPDRPACLAYQAALGSGWRVAAVDAKVLPGDRVPGSDQLALRVEPQQRTASVALVAAAPLVAPGRLLASVYGGRVRGTSLRLSASSSTDADGSRTVVLTAPPDQWTAFSVDLARLLPAGAVVRRIDFGLAYDLTPNTGRFFLDGVELTD